MPVIKKMFKTLAWIVFGAAMLAGGVALGLWLGMVYGLPYVVAHGWLPQA